METLPDILKAWRTAQGLTQEEAADLCPGITRSAWAMAERGERVRLHDRTLKSVAIGTGLDYDRILLASKRAEIQRLQQALAVG